MPFEFRSLSKLKELTLIEPVQFQDERGWFREEYKRSEFANHGIGYDFPQDNQSYSKSRGTLRGLHFQNVPAAQGKLITCLAGDVFDVAVDIRIGSPTYGQWEVVSLSAENHRILWIPPGFAHGFQTLTDNSVVMYKVTREHSASNERSVRWNDPELNIKWPIADPILSRKDAEAPLLSEVDNNNEWRKGKALDSV
jgi:dTDP-4-dehydrorhamnose 3,5-epimerase